MAIELQPVGEDAPTAEAPEETPEAPETEAASAAPEAEMLRDMAPLGCL